MGGGGGIGLPSEGVSFLGGSAFWGGDMPFHGIVEMQSPCEHTDAHENITFPKLRWREVKDKNNPEVGTKIL